MTAQAQAIRKVVPTSKAAPQGRQTPGALGGCLERGRTRVAQLELTTVNGGSLGFQSYGESPGVVLRHETGLQSWGDCGML